MPEWASAAPWLLGLGAFFLVLGLYYGLKMWLPSGAWWEVLARFLTALVAAGGQDWWYGGCKK